MSPSIIHPAPVPSFLTARASYTSLLCLCLLLAMSLQTGLDTAWPCESGRCGVKRNFQYSPDDLCAWTSWCIVLGFSFLLFKVGMAAPSTHRWQ